jgi:hypothetical protein
MVLLFKLAIPLQHSYSWNLRKSIEIVLGYSKTNALSKINDISLGKMGWGFKRCSNRCDKLPWISLLASAEVIRTEKLRGTLFKHNHKTENCATEK